MTSTIGIGTTKVAEWAKGFLLNCQTCKGKGCYTLPEPTRRLPDCLECGGTGAHNDWLNGMGDGTDPVAWRVYSDYLEDHGDDRAEMCRMVARLLPLDVWPDTRPTMSNRHLIQGWWPRNRPSESAQVPTESCIKHLGFTWQHKSISDTQPSIEAALVRLDKAIHPKEYQ